MEIRSYFNFDLDKNSDDTAYTETMPSLTIQSQTEDTDLNVIMKRFGVTGQMPTNLRIPTYGDFSGINNFTDAWLAVKNAEDNFMKIPAEIRARFQNNPQLFLEYCADPDNMPALREMGLAKPETILESTRPSGSNAPQGAPGGRPSGDRRSQGDDQQGGNSGGRSAPA